MHYDSVQRAVSAACLPADTILSLRPSSDSTVPLEFINYETDYGNDGVGELVCHVRGGAEDLDAAAIALTNSGRRNLQLIALAANAAVLPPHIETVYEARPNGSFVALRTLGNDPQVARRTIDVDRTLRLIGAFAAHPRETRLLRAAENYGEALRRTEPAASIHALLHLWIAVENLTVVVAARLMEDAAVDSIAALGVSLGVDPRPGRDRPFDGDVYGVLRRRDIFAGDDDAHRALREASNGIEHGYLNFGDARRLVDAIFDRAAAHVRTSILRESAIAEEDIVSLTTGIYTRPLPVWRPRLLARGHWTADRQFDFQRPVHIRVDGALRVESIDPTEHATAAAVDTQVRTLNGLKHVLEEVEFGAPGSLGELSSNHDGDQ